MLSTEYPETFKTDDRNLAALLRVNGVTQEGRQAEPTRDPNKPRYYFLFEEPERCETIAEQALLGTIEVNYRRFITEQTAIMDQIFATNRRRRPDKDDEVTPSRSRTG